MGCSFPRMSHTTRQLEPCLWWPQDLSQGNIMPSSVCEARNLNCIPPSWKIECVAFSHFREKCVSVYQKRGSESSERLLALNYSRIGHREGIQCLNHVTWKTSFQTVFLPVKWEQWCCSLLAGRRRLDEDSLARRNKQNSPEHMIN